MRKCPNCKSESNAEITVSTAYEYGASLVHQGSGKVRIFVCTDCGILFVGDYNLEKIRESEKFKSYLRKR